MVDLDRWLSGDYYFPGEHAEGTPGEHAEGDRAKDPEIAGRHEA
jgi:endogenous inhibitor of DNA gyrase (YacG/DUF329 family)